MDRRGSFFKLIHRFSSEIRELSNEIMQAASLADGEPAEAVPRWLESQTNDVFLESSTFGNSPATRDSGYDSLRRQISVLDRLKQTHPVWLLLGLGDEEATRILQSQPPGVFLVRKSARLKKKVISLRMDAFSDDVVQDFPVKESLYTFCLEGSGIGFADLFHMVAFYCINRDVLPFTLRLPEAIATTRSRACLEEIAQLGPGFWGSTLCREKGDSVAQTAGKDDPAATWTRVPYRAGTSQSGAALCFLNPIFLQDLDPKKKSDTPPSPQTAPLTTSTSCPPPPQEKPRMPEMAYWINPVPESHLLDTKSPGAQTVQKMLYRSMLRSSGYSTSSGVDDSTSRYGQDDGVAPGTVERRESDNRISLTSISTSSSDSVDVGGNRYLIRGMTDSSVEEEEEEKEDEGEEVGLEEEDYSISLESEREATSPFPVKVRQRSSSASLSRALHEPLSRMKVLLGSLVIPEHRAVRQVQHLARDKTTYFGCLVQDFVTYLRENHSCHASSVDLLQTLRQFITQSKSYLAQSSELDPPIHTFIPEDQIDQVLEKAVQKCVLKPLKSTVETALQGFLERSGEWQRLKENTVLAKAKPAREFGVDGVTAPDRVVVEKIRNKLRTMQKMYSPEKKVKFLLQVCKLIYVTMEGTSGRSYGADEFLPLLTYTLAQCEMPHLDIEILYMMELLEPSQLNGEGGYYVTSFYGAMSLIKNMQEEQAARVLSSETQNTLKQWHRRRTARHSTPSIEDLQNYLRVAFQDSDTTGYTAKTIPVASRSTAEEVCQVCADRFHVGDPESHALFLLTGGTCRRLTPDAQPLRIKAEIHAQPQRHSFRFLYCRVSDLCDSGNQQNGKLAPL